MRQELAWIDSQRQRMEDLLIEWAQINSFSYNIEGLREVTAKIVRAFESSGGQMRIVDLPPQNVVDSTGRLVERPLGAAISIVKRPQAARRIFLGIHMDTVYPPEHDFPVRLEGQRLRGPGVADAKGGLVVMLTALEAFEQSGLAEKIGWEILINSDEEIGSPSSVELFVQAAKRNQFGLLFEPCWPDGTLVSQRRGSGNFALVVHGKAAHAGRDPQNGRNAIHALAEFVVRLQSIASAQVNVNVGKIEGGGPVNVVPDLAIARFNLRVDSIEDQNRAEAAISGLVADLNRKDGIRAELHGRFHCPPKALDEPTQKLMERVEEAGCELGLNMAWRSSGGVTDGNKLAAAGLPNIDCLGVRGGGVHSSEEYMELDSLTERAKLATLVLTKLAQ